MTDKVDVTLAHPYDGKAPGAKLTVERGDAKRLIRAGVAVPATAAAKAVDPPADPPADPAPTGRK